MAIKSGFFQSIEGDRPYVAEDFNGLFNEIFTEGIFKLSADSEPFTVSLNNFAEPVSLLSRERIKDRSAAPRITQLGEIVVSPGYAWLNKIWIRNDSDAVFPLLLHESFSGDTAQTWKVRVYLKTDPDLRAGNVVCINGALVSTNNMADPNLDRGFPDPIEGEVHYDIIGEITVTSNGSVITNYSINSLGNKKLSYVTSKITSDKISISDGIIDLNASGYSTDEIISMVNNTNIKQSFICVVPAANVTGLQDAGFKSQNALVLNVMRYGSNGLGKQMCFPHTESTIYVRTANDTTWNAWQRMATGTDVDLKVAKAGDTMSGALKIDVASLNSGLVDTINNSKAPLAIGNMADNGRKLYGWYDCFQAQYGATSAPIYLNPYGGEVILGKAGGDKVVSRARLVVPAGTNKPGNDNGGLLVGSTTNNPHLNIFNYGLWACTNTGAPATLFLNHWTYRLLNENGIGTANYTHRTFFPTVIGNQLKMDVASDNAQYYQAIAIMAMPCYTKNSDGTITTHTNYGADIIYGGGGQTTMVSAGESANYYFNWQDSTITALSGEILPENSESLFLTADQHIELVANYATPANRRLLHWNASGQLIALGAGNNELGHVSYPWKRMYLGPTASTWLNGHKGASGGIYTTTKSASTSIWLPLINAGSMNGRISIGILGGSLMAVYAANTLISAGTNSNTTSCTLFDEAGQSWFNTIKQGVWNGTTIGVAYGGTGATTLTSGAALIGNGTGTVQTRAITNNTSNTTALTRSTNLVTMNTLSYGVNRTTPVAAADTAYTTYMARGIAASTATPSSLVNGTIHLKYS